MIRDTERSLEEDAKLTCEWEITASDHGGEE